MKIAIKEAGSARFFATTVAEEVNRQSIKRVNEKYTVDVIAKSFFTRIATWIFCEEIVKSAQLSSCYFTWNTYTALACMMAGTNIFLGSMVPVAQKTFRDFLNVVIENPTNSDLHRDPLLKFVFIFMLSGGVHALNSWMCKRLRDDLVYVMRGDLAEYWVETNADGKYLNTSSGIKIKDPKYDIVFTTRKFGSTLVNLANARLQTLSHFFGALRALYLNSGFLELGLFSLTFEIPYLLLVCFVYVYGFNFVSSWADAIFKKNTEEEYDTLNELSKVLNKKKCSKKALDDMLDEITNDEEVFYGKENTRIHDINRRSLPPHSGLFFLNKINPDLSMLIGALVQIKTGVIDAISISYTAQNFSLAASLASWKRTNLEVLKSLENCTDRLQKVFGTIYELNRESEFDVIVVK